MEERALKFSDGHSDFLSKALKSRDISTLASSPERLREGGVVFQVYAIYVGGGSGESSTKEALRQIELFHRLDGIKRIFRKSDLPGEDSQDVHAMLAFEGLIPVDGYPELLRLFHTLGVRMASLVWSRVNTFADGSLFGRKQTGRGISTLGKEALSIMEELGWVLDISHLNDEGVEDVFKYFSGPVVATHSCVRRLCDIPRNLPDEFIKEIAARGGVIGINFAPMFLTCESHATAMDIVRHMEYIINLVGENHVALGSDFDGLSVYPEDLQGADMLPVLGHRMIEAFGYDVAEKIAWKNWVRVMEGALPG